MNPKMPLWIEFCSPFEPKVGFLTGTSGYPSLLMCRMNFSKIYIKMGYFVTATEMGKIGVMLLQLFDLSNCSGV